MTILISVVSFIVTIGVLISVHEFGHYWVARKLGVKVLRFSIGFGRPLWAKIAGDDKTEYVIAAIPLGGYVKMLDEHEGEVDESEVHRAFNRKSLPRRAAIVAAGPLFNLLFAVFAYWIIFMVGIQGVKPVIGEVIPGSIAAQSGFQQGDQILKVSGEQTSTWGSASLALINLVVSDSKSEILVEDVGGQSRVLNLVNHSSKEVLRDNRLLENLGVRPWRPRLDPILGEIVPGGAAARADLRVGDTVISADGEHIADWGQWVEYVRARPGQSIKLQVERDATSVEVDLVPDHHQSKSGTIGRIGAIVVIPPDLFSGMRAEERYSALPAMGVAVSKTWDMSLLMLRMLGKMIVGSASVDNISGPISIAQYAGQTASVGFVPFMAFLAVISISLGVLNLLPIPLLDGGHLFYYLIEAVRGKPLSIEVQAVGQRIGIAVLLVLMVFAFYNDFTRLMG